MKKASLLRQMTLIVFLLALIAAGIGGLLLRASEYSAHLEAGKQALAAGNRDKAVAEFTKAIRLAPEKTEAFRLRGLAFLEKKNWKRAVSDLSKVIEDSPDAETYVKRAKAFWHWGKAEDNLQYVQNAIDDATSTIELDRKESLAFHYRALARNRLFQSKKALKDAEQAVILAPKNPRMYYCRGKILIDQGQEKQAIEDLTKAIALDPDYAVAYAERGIAWLNLREYEKALADCNQAVQLASGDATVYGARADVFMELNYWNKALADLDKAKQLESGNMYGYGLRVLCHLARGNVAKAREETDAAMQINDRSPIANMLLGACCLLSGRTTAATSHIDNAIELDPENPLLYGFRAELYEGLGKYSKAIQNYSRCLEIDTFSAYKSHLKIAVCHLHLKKKTKAMESCNRAIGLLPNAPEGYVLRSVIRDNGAPSKDVEEDFTKALKLDAYETYLFRGEMYIALKKNALAVNRAAPAAAMYIALKKNVLAVKDFGNAIKLMPNDASAYLGRADAHLAIEPPRVHDALQDCEKVLQLEPGNVLALQLRAAAHSSNKNYAAAMKDCDDVLKRDPENVHALLLRAGVHLEQGSNLKAIHDSSSAIALENQEAAAYAIRGIAYAQKPDFDEARQDLQNAAKLDSKFQELLAKLPPPRFRGGGAPIQPLVAKQPKLFPPVQIDRRWLQQLQKPPQKFELPTIDLEAFFKSISVTVWVVLGIIVFFVAFIAGIRNKKIG